MSASNLHHSSQNASRPSFRPQVWALGGIIVILAIVIAGAVWLELRTGRAGKDSNGSSLIEGREHQRRVNKYLQELEVQRGFSRTKARTQNAESAPPIPYGIRASKDESWIAIDTAPEVSPDSSNQERLRIVRGQSPAGIPAQIDPDTEIHRDLVMTERMAEYAQQDERAFKVEVAEAAARAGYQITFDEKSDTAIVTRKPNNAR